MNVWVIEPGHGSTWLMDAHYEGQWVVGWAWDDSQRGSAMLPDDYTGEMVEMAFPRRYILRVEEAAR